MECWTYRGAKIQGEREHGGGSNDAHLATRPSVLQVNTKSESKTVTVTETGAHGDTDATHQVRGTHNQDWIGMALTKEINQASAHIYGRLRVLGQPYVRPAQPSCPFFTISRFTIQAMTRTVCHQSKLESQSRSRLLP
jgi:hypothetical protein